MRNKLNFILSAVLAMTLFAGACKDKNVTEVNKPVDSTNKSSNGANIQDAGKLVDSADKKAVEAKDLFNKIPDTFIKILNDLDQKKDFADSKKRNETEVKELAKSWDKIIETFKSAGVDYREAAKASQKQVFKDYYETKAKAQDSLAEISGLNREMLQSFLDSSDLEAFDKKMDDIGSKVEASKKQGVEFNEKLKKIEDDIKAQNK